jgi:hypothetical protein
MFLIQLLKKMVLLPFLTNCAYICSDIVKLKSDIWFRIYSVRVFRFTVAKFENEFLHNYALAKRIIRRIHV